MGPGSGGSGGMRWLCMALCAGLWACGLGPEEVAQIENEAIATLRDLARDGQVEGALAGEAAETLGKIRTSDTAPMLIEALEHPEEFVVLKAVRALAGEARAVAPLEALFERAGSDFVRIEAAVALEKRGWLEQTLRGGAMGIVRSNAAAGLGRLQDGAAIPALRRAFKEDPDPIVRSSAALALARLKDRRSLQAIADTLTETGSLSTALVMVEALQAFGDSAAVARLEAAVRRERWQEALRRRCLEALGALGARNIGAYLQAQLAAEADVPEQMLAVEGLGLVRDTTAVSILKAAFRSDPNMPVRLGAAWGLARLGYGREIAPELEVDLASRNEAHQIRAAEILAMIGDERRVFALKETFFLSKKPSVRQAVARALGSIQTAEAVDALKRAYKEARAQEVKEEIVEALGKIDLPEAREALLGALSDTEYATLQAGALRGLSRSGDRKQLRTLRWYFRDREPGVRFEAAAGALRLSGSIPAGDGEEGTAAQPQQGAIY